MLQCFFLLNQVLHKQMMLQFIVAIASANFLLRSKFLRLLALFCKILTKNSQVFSSFQLPLLLFPSFSSSKLRIFSFGFPSFKSSLLH